MSHFILPATDYKRDIDIISNATKQAAFYLHKRSNRPLEECLDYVIKATSKEGKFALKDPDTLVLVREKYEDKEKVIMPLSRFFNKILERKAINVPTLCCYLSPEEKVSVLGKYVDGNIKLRAQDKKDQFAAEQVQNWDLYAVKFNSQTSRKLNNNALSGAHASKSTPLHNQSSHSSLTSTCRVATSYGNANNEMFIMGNRHYWSAEVVKAKIITICLYTDMVTLQRVMDTYNLYYPTTDDVMDVITYSTDLYGINKRFIDEIALLVDTLTPLERAAFVYVGDLWHLAKYNLEFVSTFIRDIGRRVTDLDIENPDSYISNMDGDIRAYVGILCEPELKGTNIPVVKAENYEGYLNIARTAKNIDTQLNKYKLLIKGLWVTENLPSSIFNVPTIIRRCVTTSDTDSTIFTTQEWIKLLTGTYKINTEARGISSTIAFLASQTIQHVLAKVSGNMGVSPQHIFRIAMKNEFLFPVSALTNRAKHYFAIQGAQEGNVKLHFDLEIKGVELRSSKVPIHVNKKLSKLIEFILMGVHDNGNLSLYDVLDEVALLENNIIDSVKNSDYSYMLTQQIKDPSSYVNEEEAATYKHYLLYKKVFAKKYGEVAPPPYLGIKIPLNLPNKTAIKQWTDQIPDPYIKSQLEELILNTGRKDIGSIIFPETVLNAYGLPSEIIPAINIRQMVFETMSGFYLVLESLGLYFKDSNTTKLLSDSYVPRITKSKFD